MNLQHLHSRSRSITLSACRFQLQTQFQGLEERPHTPLAKVPLQDFKTSVKILTRSTTFLRASTNSNPKFQMYGPGPRRCQVIFSHAVHGNQDILLISADNFSALPHHPPPPFSPEQKHRGQHTPASTNGDTKRSQVSVHRALVCMRG
jgi:hypothetical protein